MSEMENKTSDKKNEMQVEAAFLSSGVMLTICRLLLFALAVACLPAFSASVLTGMYVLLGGGVVLLVLYWMAAMLHHQERIDRALNRTDDTKDTD